MVQAFHILHYTKLQAQMKFNARVSLKSIIKINPLGDPSEKRNRSCVTWDLYRHVGKKGDSIPHQGGSGSKVLLYQSAHLPKVARCRGNGYLACLPADAHGALMNVAQSIHPNHLCEN